MGRGRMDFYQLEPYPAGDGNRAILLKNSARQSGCQSAQVIRDQGCRPPSCVMPTMAVLAEQLSLGDPAL